MFSVYYCCMSRPARPFSAFAWTPKLAGLFGEAMGAIGRLDAKISASPVAAAWRTRSSWGGYATALRLQRYEIDEIDAFSFLTGFPIVGRLPIATHGHPFDDYPDWIRSLGQPKSRHWRDDLPFTFDTPASWGEAPPLIRALTMLDIWSRKDSTAKVWLRFPHLLAGMGLTATPLPCLVIGDASLRTLYGARERQLKRLLKAVQSSAAEGLERLERLEAWRLECAAVLAREHRPGLLAQLGKLALVQPFMSARLTADTFGITLSGAGKLLMRAASKGLLIEVSGRASWRLYVTPDVGIALGMVAPPRGRPPSPPQHTEKLDAALAEFDREMDEIDALLARGAVASAG